MERPWGEISQERKEEKLEGETDGKPGDLGWAGLSEPRDSPSLLSTRGLWLSCFRFESLPPQPLLCPQRYVPPLYCFYLSLLISPHVPPPHVHHDPNKGGLACT